MCCCNGYAISHKYNSITQPLEQTFNESLDVLPTTTTQLL